FESNNMRNGMKAFLVTGLSFALLQPVVPAAENKTDLKDQKEKVSYSIGMNVGNSLKRLGYEVDVDVLASAIRDVLAGKDTKLTEAQMREVMTSYSKELAAKHDEERVQKAEKNRKEGDAFLAEN